MNVVWGLQKALFDGRIAEFPGEGHKNKALGAVSRPEKPPTVQPALSVSCCFKFRDASTAQHGKPSFSTRKHAQLVTLPVDNG